MIPFSQEKFKIDKLHEKDDCHSCCPFSATLESSSLNRHVFSFSKIYADAPVARMNLVNMDGSLKVVLFPEICPETRSQTCVSITSHLSDFLVLCKPNRISYYLEN